MSKISDKLKRLGERIAAACDRARREHREVSLIVVTKSAELEDIKEVIRLGFYDLGESRVQNLKKIVTDVEDFLREGEDKFDLPEKVNWHMIGHLQRNKVKQVLPSVSVIHSVDTLRLAEEISHSAEKMGLHPKILLQVNASEEPQKYGVPVGAATHLAEQIVTLPNIKLVGLMTMAPLTLDKDVIRPCFTRVRELFEEIRRDKIAGNGFVHLSMGMSQDFEIAIEEGATILRIGSAIFAD